MSIALVESITIFVLLLVNGVLAMSEMAVVSSRKARLQTRSDHGDRGARAALELANEPTQFLSTVQFGITLIGILAGAFGGATLAEQLAVQLDAVPWIAPRGEAISVVLVVVVITFLSVIFGELVPKRLALSDPERIASLIAGPMRTLSWLAGPVVRFLGATTDLTLRILRIKQAETASETEDEIKILLREGAESGTFEQAEQRMIENVFRLGDLRVSSLMTPRTETVWADLDDPVVDNLRKMAASGHSLFPVCQGNRDRILGVVSVKKLWNRVVEGEPPDLTRCMQKPLFVPESVRAMRLLELYKQHGIHLALVIDEYGGFQGIVTLNDVLGAVAGDVTWTDGDDEVQVVRREDGSWLMDGLLPIDELKRVLEVRELPGEEERSYQTLAGFVMSSIGKVPRAGDHFDWNGLRFEVVDMDERRVDKVLVAAVVADESSEGSDLESPPSA